MSESVKASTDPKVAADVIAEEAYQRVKISAGADGSATDVSSAAPLPVDDDATQVLLTAIKALLEGTGTVKVTDGGGSFGVDDNGGSLTVDGTVAISGEPAVKVDSALPTGANAIGKLAANSGVDIGDVDVTSLTGGTIAHDAADSGNPIKVGGRARTELPAAVAQNDRADVITDKFGRQLVAPAPLDQRVSSTLNRVNLESGQLLAAVASTAYVITAIKVVNGHATVGTKVEILDGETVKDKGFAGPLGGGWNLSDPNGLFVGTVNTKLAAKCATTGADVDIFVSGYKIPA
jgi:hypothetical protein